MTGPGDRGPGRGGAELEIGALDAASGREFVAAVAPLFEGAPGFLWRLAAARPFGSWDELFRRARRVARLMPEPLQVELIDAHPRLGAPPASVSPMSFREQEHSKSSPRAASARNASSYRSVRCDCR